MTDFTFCFCVAFCFCVVGCASAVPDSVFLSKRPPLSLSDAFGFCIFCGGRDITTHRVAVIVRLGLGLGLGLALGQVRVMVRVRVSSVPPRREHSGVPPAPSVPPLPAVYPLPRSRSAIGYIKTGIDGRRLRRSVVARYVRVPRLQLEGCDVHGQSLTVMSYSLSA